LLDRQLKENCGGQLKHICGSGEWLTSTFAALMHKNVRDVTNYTYQKCGLRRQHGPYSTEHGAHGHHGSPHPGGEYLRCQHVNDAKRDGYREFTDQEKRQLY